MTFPGPAQLGRSVVVCPGAAPPDPWSDAPRVVVDDRLLADPERLKQAVLDLQRRYVHRESTVFELAVDASKLTVAETTGAPPYELGPFFTFLRDRLAKTIWHNSYDARGEEPIWWWAHKAAARIDVEVGGPADVLGSDGTQLWIDGGPLQPLGLSDGVIHHHSIELGHSTRVARAQRPTTDLAGDQLDAVSHPVGPARVIAPAGSGKTRVLTARARHLIDNLGVDSELVTALAYNRRAAEEMRHRLRGCDGVGVRTIHSIGWEILRMARSGVSLIDEREQRRLLEPLAPAPPRVNADVIGPYLEGLDEVRVGLRDPAAVEASRDDIPGFAETFRQYRDVLDRRNEADHSEQIYGAIEALCRQPDLRAHWQQRCRHLLVDEFQDLTPAYLLLVRLLASPGLNVFGVGDDDQVIYGYAGADPSFLIDYENLFPGAGAHALEVNYRCPIDVVDAAANLLGYNLKRVEKTIRAASKTKGFKVVLAPGSELGVAAVERIQALSSTGVAAESIAVLARVNSSLLPLHVTMAERGVPFRSPLAVSVLERTVVKGALAWVRIALNTSAMARSDLFEVIRRPQRGITRLFGEMIGHRRGPFSLSELLDMAKPLDGRRRSRWDAFCRDIAIASRSSATTSALLDVLATDVGLDRAAAALDAGRTRADKSAQGDDLTALRRVASLQPDPAKFEPWLRDRLQAKQADDGVTLSTVHRVKGLEWDHVVVFGADRGSMPHELAPDVEEERRVFHVALTRGRESVTVMGDSHRPSRFLSEVDGSAPLPGVATKVADQPESPGIADGVFVAVSDEITIPGGFGGSVVEILTTGVLVRVSTGATMAVPWGEKVSKAGVAGRLAPGLPGPDPGLVQLLKDWRLAEAQRQAVPAYVVFNDRTLEELASRRPTTDQALLAVPGIGPAKLESYGDALLDLLG